MDDRTRHLLRVVSILQDWQPHSPDALQAMLEILARLREQGDDVREDG